MSVHVDTSETDALAGRLEQKAATVDRQVSSEIRRVAAAIASDAKGLAPVDTGALRDSISATVRGMSVEVGPTVDYGVYQEYGTSEVGAQPFMGPAFDRRRPGLEAALAELAKRGL